MKKLSLFTFVILLLFPKFSFAYNTINLNSGWNIVSFTNLGTSDLFNSPPECDSISILDDFKSIVFQRNFIGVNFPIINSKKYAVKCSQNSSWNLFPETLSCSQQSGTTCINNSSQGCLNNQWTTATDTDYCCLSQCILNPTCETSGNYLCFCSINPNKDKFAVIVKENGELDTPEITNSISDYINEASQQTKKVSAGLIKFSGSTKDGLSQLVSQLYEQRGVGSIILVGTDLPIFLDLSSSVTVPDEDFINSMSFQGNRQVSRSRLDRECRDIVFSYVVPRFLGSSNYSASNFIKTTFTNFADYHANRNNRLGNFKKESLEISWNNAIDDACGMHSYNNSLVSVLPTTSIFNTQHQTLSSKILDKYAFLQIHVHGNSTIQALGLNDYPDGDISCSSVYTYINEMERYHELFLMVDSGVCGGIQFDRTIENCCWPQKYLELGAWSYSSLGGSEHQIRKVYDTAFSGQTLSDGVKKYPVQVSIVGDLLAGD